MTKFWTHTILFSVLSLLAWGGSAHATLLFALDNGCTGCGSSPWGTVQVWQDASGSNAIDFTITLNSPYQFHRTTSAQHRVFAVDINVLNVTFSNFKLDNVATTKVTTVAGGTTSAGYGTFPYALSASQNLSGILTFTATAPVGTSLHPANIVSNGKAYMVADIINILNGGTGNVADTNPPVHTPEPSGVALLGLGLACLGWVSKRRRSARLAKCPDGTSEC